MKRLSVDTLENKIKRILEANQIEKDFKQRIVLCEDGNHLVIELSNIVRLESVGNYTTFYLSDGRSIISSKTLRKYDDQLPESCFFRIFRSHIINMNFVTSFAISVKSTVTMSDGKILELSRSKKKKFFELMEKF